MNESQASRASMVRALRSPLAEKLGITSIEGADGTARVEMPYDATNTTTSDIVHGGAILSLADVAATASIWSTVEDPARYRGLTIDLSLSFIAAARSRDLVANARVIKRGRSICYSEVEVETSDGEIVAKAKVAYKLSKIESPAEVMAGLFRGRSTGEQMALLAELERAGAGIYRAMADATAIGKGRDALFASAEREEENARTLDALAPVAGAAS